MTPIYLDHAASTPVLPEVIDRITDVLRSTWGNPSSHHRHGFEAARILSESRAQVANSVKANSKGIYFTSGATEAINLGLRTFFKERRGHVVASKVEHKAVLETLRDLESCGQIEITWIQPTLNGTLGPEDFSTVLRHDTCLAVCMWVNNETGAINRIPEIHKMLSARGIPLFCDATQAIGKVPVDLEAHTDIATFSGHKIGGPKGVGALWVNPTLKNKIRPIVTGGGQESGIRPGTENLPGIAGFALACEIATQCQPEVAQHCSDLKTLLLELLRPLDARVSIRGECVPHIISLLIPGADNQILLAQMREHASFSLGSACNSLRHEPSPVLLSSGLSEEAATSTIRVSLARSTTNIGITSFTARLTALMQNREI